MAGSAQDMTYRGPSIYLIRYTTRLTIEYGNEDVQKKRLMKWFVVLEDVVTRRIKKGKFYELLS